MDDIAQAAQLSKGGLYAHFPSKEALLQTLLERQLELPMVEEQDWWPDRVQTLEQLVDAFVDHTLQRLAEPTTLPVLRLLLAESPRLPPGLRDWHQRMLQLHAQTHARLMQCAVDQGLLQKGVRRHQGNLGESQSQPRQPGTQQKHPPPLRLGLARRLASVLGAEHVAVDAVSAQALTGAVDAWRERPTLPAAENGAA